MAKKGIHPELHDVTISFLDGSKMQTKSTTAKDIFAEVDIKKHPAWQKGVVSINSVNVSVKKFMDKFKHLGIMDNENDNDK